MSKRGASEKTSGLFLRCVRKVGGSEGEPARVVRDLEMVNTVFMWFNLLRTSVNDTQYFGDGVYTVCFFEPSEGRRCWEIVVGCEKCGSDHCECADVLEGIKAYPDDDAELLSMCAKDPLVHRLQRLYEEGFSYYGAAEIGEYNPFFLFDLEPITPRGFVEDE